MDESVDVRTVRKVLRQISTSLGINTKLATAKTETFMKVYEDERWCLSCFP